MSGLERDPGGTHNRAEVPGCRMIDRATRETGNDKSAATAPGGETG
jgi:hypothetical protein